MQLQDQNIYRDTAGSLPDRQVEKENARGNEGVTALFALLHDAADVPAADSSAALRGCAVRALDQWARAGSLLAEPPTAAGRVRRVLDAVALNSFALKLSEAGPLTGPTKTWLAELTRLVMRDYGRDALTGTPFFRNNVYYWTAVAAGLSDLVSPDDAAAAFARQAWRDAIAAIRDDGTLDAEMRRGARALIYHQFSLSALLMLRSIDLAARDDHGAADDDRLRKLATAVAEGLCDSQQIATKAGAQQEKPGSWGTRVASAFGDGVMDPDWKRCADLDVPTDLSLGGDLRATRSAIESRIRENATHQPR